MFYSELFECVPLKVEDGWRVIKQDKTFLGLKAWFDYTDLEEDKLIDYLLRIDVQARQLYIDDVINRFIEAFNHLYKAYEETDSKDVYEVLIVVRGVLSSLNYRFESLDLACNVSVVDKWSAKFPFMMDFPKLGEASTDDPKEGGWPKELNNVNFKKIIEKGVEMGVIEYNLNGLKWNETKELLAYFAECISTRYKMSKKTDNQGNPTISWKPFEKLFGAKDLKGAKQNWMRLNTQFTPNRYEEIDKLLDEGATHL